MKGARSLDLNASNHNLDSSQSCSPVGNRASNPWGTGVSFTPHSFTSVLQCAYSPAIRGNPKRTLQLSLEKKTPHDQLPCLFGEGTDFLMTLADAGWSRRQPMSGI